MKDSITNVCLSFQCPLKWEQFQEMSSTERFCSTCRHSVKDFTNATQQEYEDAIAASPKRLCGRFKKSQLNSNYLSRIAATVVMATAVACNPGPRILPSQEISRIENTAGEEETLLGDVKFRLDSLEEEFLAGIILIEEEDSVNEKD